jgi:small-conductance mechanosensitive channel
LGGVSIVAARERPRPESELSLLRLLMAAIAMVLLIYAAGFLVVIEFVYRHLIAAPIAWLLTRLGRLSAALRG